MFEYQNKTTQVVLEKKAQKVLCVSAAFNDTFVMTRIDKPCSQESIVHFDAKGKILYEHTYNDIIDSFGQMNDRQVIVLNVPQQKIDIINLETKTIKFVNHKYLFQDTTYMNIYNFPETRTFCVLEKGGFGDDTFRLSYYQYDNLQQDSKPIAVYMSKDKEWTYDYVVQKGNNHSKIIWFTYKQQQQVSFKYFDLKDSPQGKLNVVRAVNTLAKAQGMDSIILSIESIWECRENEYMICGSRFTPSNSQAAAESKQNENNNFILDARHGNDKGSLRQTKFVFNKSKDGFSYNGQLIDSFGVGNISVFHTFRHDKGKTLETPIYYVNNVTQEILGEDSWFCSCYTSNYYFPGWGKNTYIQAQHDNGDVQKIIIRQKSFSPSNSSIQPK